MLNIAYHIQLILPSKQRVSGSNPDGITSQSRSYGLVFIAPFLFASDLPAIQFKS